MPEIIKAKPNKDGKVIVKLFGQEYDVTKKLKDGVVTLNLYGTDYEIRCSTEKKIKVKQAKSEVEEVEIGYVESPKKD